MKYVINLSWYVFLVLSILVCMPSSRLHYGEGDYKLESYRILSYMSDGEFKCRLNGVLVSDYGGKSSIVYEYPESMTSTVVEYAKEGKYLVERSFWCAVLAIIYFCLFGLIFLVSIFSVCEYFEDKENYEKGWKSKKPEEPCMLYTPLGLFVSTENNKSVLAVIFGSFKDFKNMVVRFFGY